jgi:uridine monophosphate synthetase
VTNTFFTWLEARARATGSLLCVGLDPRASTAEAALLECLRLIEATAEFACAFKANSAFFERHGPAGLAALRQVIAAVPAGIPTILDAKRGDIGDTSEAYAQAAFESLGAHAVTVSPYLGRDGVAPFLGRPGRGVFVLCKTSNPGADEFQGLEVGGRPLHEIVAERVQTWGAPGDLGLVVAATDALALRRVRDLAPDLWFLAPGVGAQGGELEAALRAGLRADGLGLLINVSRSIARAADPRREAERLRDEITRLRAHDTRFQTQDTKGRARQPSATLDDEITNYVSRFTLTSVAQALVAAGCVKFGQFTLSSGKQSPIYLNLRQLISHPQALREVARAYAEKLAGLAFDRLAGIPYGGLPLATALALETRRPLIYNRREVKDHGVQTPIDGDFQPGETALVVDDLVTTGGTTLQSIRQFEAAGLVVGDVLVLIDREEGGREALAAAGYRLHAVVTLRALIDEWLRAGAITPEQRAQASAVWGGKT